ncbi:amphiphysin-like isoform X3 [Bolinopsis microptera]|uniref:amphiphysin-like isoform X3 n=1 Tax=Bolinopsis microptera TaxID=2820187 RepID=UPI00307A1960
MEGTKLDRIKASTGRLVGRTNERLKQKMGRSSESVVAKDDKWQVITANFNRQQAAGMRLHREVKGYIASLKTMESSTQTLLDAVREMHEYTWPGNMNLVKALQGVDKLNKELNEQMVDSLLVPVNNYVEVFSQMKVKMQKRERKLIDHTRTKRTLDTLKKGDKISPEKLGFAQDNYMQNKIVFEEVNSELCEDLPAFWDSRKTYIMQFLDGFFRSSIDFHKEFSQVYSESKDALDPLKEEIKNELPPQRDIAIVDKYFVVSENARKFKRQSMRKSFRKSGGSSFKRSLSMGALRKSKKNADTSQSISNISVDPYASPAQQATVYTPTKVGPVKPLSPARPKPPRVDLSVSESEPGGVTPYSPSINIETGTVVECIHEYKAVDEDELSFGMGDVITVVTWDSTDEQDSGWFMGKLQGSGAKGAFPINYTRKYNPNKSLKIKVEPDPLADNFQAVDLSQDDEWRNREAEYINIPELPDELPLTNGNLAYEAEPVEYSIPPRVPPKRPAAPVIAASVTAEVPDLVAAVEIEAPSVEVELETEVSAAAAIEVGTPEVELEVETETPEFSVETPEVSAGIPDFSFDTEVSVETPEVSAGIPDFNVETEVSVETPEVSAGIPDFSVDTEVSVETPEINSPVSIGVQTPNFDMEEDVMASSGAELSGETVETVVEAAVQAAEDNDVEVSVKTPGLVVCQRGVLDVGRNDEELYDEELQLDELEVGTPTVASEGEQSDSSDDLSPEEIKQKLAALGEFSDENNLSSDEEDEYKVRFDASVSMLESVPEDATDSEAESEASSVDESGVDHQKDEDDHANAKDDDDNTTSF